MSKTVSKKDVLGELWSKKAKEKMRNTLFLDEIRELFKEYLEHFTPDYTQDFQSKQELFKADAQTELIALMLKVLQ